MQEVPIFLLLSALLCLLLLNAALLIRMHLKAREKESRNYSVSSSHKHPSFKGKDGQKQEEMVDCSRKD